MQKEPSLVSVLINTKDRGRLIPIAIASALKQTYNNLEIVVIDASSTEQTRNAVMEFNDTRIKYFHSSDPKMTVCWRLGLANCLGEYIALLDDDDEWFPNKIQKQIDLFDSLDDSYGWISCGGDHYDDIQARVIETIMPNLKGDIHSKLLEKAGIGISGGSTLVFKKSALYSYGDPIANIEYSTDFLLSLWVSRHYKFDYCEEIRCIGHVNHIYESARASKLKPTTANFNNLIQWNNYILDTYQDSFSQTPILCYLYYRNLALLYAKLSKLDQTANYVYLSFKVSRGMFRKNAGLLLNIYNSFIKKVSTNDLFNTSTNLLAMAWTSG